MTEPVRKYGLDTLRSEMRLVDSKLERAIDVYLIGGCAMSYARLKAATKDIDLVLKDNQTLATLEAALTNADYVLLAGLRPEYQQLGASRYFEKPTAPQWDVYVRTVCRRLQLSPGMIARATREETGLEKLRIQRLAPPDIFIFKSITERAADKDDMDAIFASGLDWPVVLDEMRWQSQNSDVAWAVNFCQSLEAFAAAGNAVPILRELAALADQEAGEKAVIEHVRNGTTTIADLQKSIKEDPAWVEGLVSALKERGRIVEESGRLRVV